MIEGKVWLFEMKLIKRMAGIVAGILIFCVGVNVLNYIYVPASEWEDFLWHNFYEDKGKIDNLYLGSSHVFFDLDPFLLDELNGQYNFNLATPTQLMNGTYYLLREADRENELSHVYVELYYGYNVKEKSSEDKEPIVTLSYRNWNNIDYMKFSLNKLAYMHSIMDTEEYVNICIPFSRYRSKLDDWESVRQIVKEKKNINDQTNYDNGRRKKGYQYSTTVYTDEGRVYRRHCVLEEEPMTELSESYFRKTIEYCQKRDIPVTLFVSPIYELKLISAENYDNYVNQIREIADEYNVEIYDFNLAKEEYLPIQDTKYFSDAGHLNSIGVSMYTEFFHKVVSGDASENKKYFYNSYAQKLQNTAPAVYGIYYSQTEQTDDDPRMKNMWIASNRDEGMEYRIILTPDGEESYMVQDFSENKAFLDSSEHGVCTIVYRIKDMPDTVQTMEINY